MTKVLVSYSRKDSAVARKLIEAFKTINLDVWVDWEDIPPAVGWLDQIFQGIEESDAFIFLTSPDSVASEVCNVEVGHAEKNHKRIIPIVLREVDPKIVNPIIRDLNWIFIREQDVFDEGIAKVKTAIELDLPWVEEHRRLQVRALEWDRKKDPSLLLRGEDLRTAEQMFKSAGSKDPNATKLQEIYIQHSRRDENRRVTLWISTVIAVIIMIILSITAFNQSKQASANADLALINQHLAENNAVIAQANAKTANDMRTLAETSENTAKSQRSAARAQIYQSRTGELYTSTLFAIDSWQRQPSLEAEEILRKNISLLPIPVAQMTQSDSINSLEFSPNGDTFVTASADKTICVWNVKDGKKLFCAKSSGSVNDATFSPDGKILVTGDQLGEVLILDAQNGNVQNKFNLKVPVWNVNVSPDGALLAIARDDGKLSLLDMKTQKFYPDLQTSGSLHVSAFSPNGKWIAAGSSIGSITLWNLTNGKILSGPAHRKAVRTLVFSPNSFLLVSGGEDNVAIVTRTETGKELFRVQNEDRVESIAFSPDSSWFVTASDDQRIRVWDATNGEERIRMLQDSIVNEVKVSANGQWIATTGEDKTIRVWNSATGAELFQIPLKSGGSVLAFSKDGKYLVSGDRSGEVNIWDISTMAAPESYIQFHGFTGTALFSPSGDWLAASDENRVWLLDAKQLSSLTPSPQGKLILELGSNVKNLVISPDSKWIGISMESGDLAMYNVEKQTRRIVSQANSSKGLVFSPDGLQLITVNIEGKVQAWKVSTGELVNTLYESNSTATSLSTHSNLLAIGLIGKILILDLNTGKTISEIECPGDQQLIAFSSDDSQLASSNSTGQIYVWKQENGEFKLLQSINSEPAFSMTFNSKGDQLLLGEMNIVYFIDPATGGEIARLPQKDAVNSLSFSADGSLLATASQKVVQFWNVAKIPSIKTDNLVEDACARMIQNFSKAQWSAFFGSEKYRPLCPNLSSL